MGNVSGHKQDAYSHFVSSTFGDDGALWMAILGGVVYRFDGTSMTRYPRHREWQAPLDSVDL